MALAELQELKTQLQELIDFGFIRSSVPLVHRCEKEGWHYEVRDAKYFSKIDLRSGYHQLKVREEDIPKIHLMSEIP
ncbi:unnamed protein product [Prunus armeniaca]